jgi:hypothetical protein
MKTLFSWGGPRRSDIGMKNGSNEPINKNSLFILLYFDIIFSVILTRGNTMNVFNKASRNVKTKFQDKFILSILAFLLMGNVAKSQESSSQDKDSLVIDKIKKEIKSSGDNITHIIDSSITVIPDDGFFKVIFLTNYDFSDERVGRLLDMSNVRKDCIPTIRLYHENGNKLSFNVIGNFEYIRRKKDIPDIMKEYFSKYLVLEIKEITSSSSKVLYFAFNENGEEVGISMDVFVLLKEDIERRKSWDFKYKPKKLTKAEKKLLEQEWQKSN